MDRVADVHALGDELLRHLLHRVLRAGDRKAVARDDDHAFRIPHQERDAVRRAGFDAPLFGRAGGRALRRAKSAEDDAEERAVHRLAGQEAESRPGIIGV